MNLCHPELFEIELFFTLKVCICAWLHFLNTYIYIYIYINQLMVRETRSHMRYLKSGLFSHFIFHIETSKSHRLI